MPYPEKIERNEMVFHLIDSGHTFAEVAQIFSINPTRVLQIYNAMFRKSSRPISRALSRKSKMQFTEL